MSVYNSVWLGSWRVSCLSNCLAGWLAQRVRGGVSSGCKVGVCTARAWLGPVHLTLAILHTSLFWRGGWWCLILAAQPVPWHSVGWPPENYFPSGIPSHFFFVPMLQHFHGNVFHRRMPVNFLSHAGEAVLRLKGEGSSGRFRG